MFVYLLRSIKARWLENLGIVAVFTVVSATATLILSFAATMQKLALSHGDASTVVLISRGATSVNRSAVGKEGYDWARVRPELEQRAGAALISPELVSRTMLRTPNGVSLWVPVRGVDPIAFQVHDRMRVIRGRLPEPGSDEIVIGKMLDGTFPNFSVGGSWGNHPIVGVFDSRGSPLETEVWVDRKRMAVELGRKVSEPIAFAYMKAKSPADAAGLANQINESKQPLQAFTEPEYLEIAGDDSKELMRLAFVFSMLLALGAGIASVNTLYSSLLGRQSEFATLYAIGVTRRTLTGLILQESVVLALAGIALGLGITLALDGQQIARLWTDHPFEQVPLHVGLQPLAMGAAIGLAVGVAGGLIPGLSILRMDMKKALV